MSAKLLKQVLETTGLTVIDVAAATKVSLTTIARYLRGSRVNRSTESLLEQWVSKHSKNTGGTAA